MRAVMVLSHVVFECAADRTTTELPTRRINNTTASLGANRDSNRLRTSASARLASSSATAPGSCTSPTPTRIRRTRIDTNCPGTCSSTASRLTVAPIPTRLISLKVALPRPSSRRLATANTSPDPSSLTWILPYVTYLARASGRSVLMDTAH
jgi:hypothetical protein